MSNIATPEMIAAAWDAWKSRPGWKLGPGPAFREAIEAALSVRSKEPELEHHVLADLAARLAKAERALEEANDWRPMESAPRDGTEILAAIEVHNTAGRKWWERHVISFDECRNEIGLDYDHGWSWEDYIRWRPLPSPPKEGE